jgi:flagellar basal-body rod modification protein FlgD
MAIDFLNAVSSGGGLPSEAADRLPVKTLSQQDFLKLLIAQLTSQDPLSPQKDTEFIAQMTQFSTLEQSKSMQSDISRLRTDQQILQATALLGRAVEVRVDENTISHGVVNAVRIEAGMPKVVVGDQSYSLNQLLSVAPASP